MTLATSVLLFYEINVILSNFSFSKSTESLQTSLHHQVPPKDYGACIQKIMERASKRLWNVHPKVYGACIQKIMEHASKRLWSMHPKDYGACIQKIMERASKRLWSVHPKDYGACMQKFMERASKRLWCVHPKDYGACRRRKQIALLKLCDFAGFVLISASWSWVHADHGSTIILLSLLCVQK